MSLNAERYTSKIPYAKRECLYSSVGFSSGAGPSSTREQRRSISD